MPRKSTSTVQGPGAPMPVAEPTPAEREALATQALSDTRDRLSALEARLNAIEGEVATLDAEVSAAQAVAAEAHARAVSLSDAIRGAKARLLVVAGHPSAVSAQAAVAEAEQAAAEAEGARDAAAARAAKIADDADTRRTMLQAERDAISAEQGDLAALVQHLEHEVAEARAAQGEALLEAARAEVVRLLAAEDEARARLAEAERAVAAHRAEVAEQLAAYPLALAQVADTPLAVPMEPGAEVRIVETYLSHLDALETGFGHIGHQAAGGVPLWAVITSGTGLPGVLASLNPSYVPGKRAAARTWLEALAEGRA
jgi:hypothetical protein